MSLEEHILRRDNPHQVTKEQVGLGLVQNYPLASQNEITSMTTAERYIDSAHLVHVQTALRNYMTQLGLLNAQGNLAVAPIDTAGTIEFMIYNNGTFVLNGIHPAAAMVDVYIYLGNQKVAERLGINLNNQRWNYPNTTLVFNAGETYEARVNYRNAQGRQLSKGNKFSEFNNSIPADAFINFLMEPSGRFLFYGYAPGAISGRVVVTDPIGTQVWVRENVSVELGTGYWSIDATDATLNPTVAYTATFYAYNAIPEEMWRISTTVVVVEGEDGVALVRDQARNAWYYDFKPYTAWEGVDPSLFEYVDFGRLN